MPLLDHHAGQLRSGADQDAQGAIFARPAAEDAQRPHLASIDQLAKGARSGVDAVFQLAHRELTMLGDPARNVPGTVLYEVNVLGSALRRPGLRPDFLGP